MTQFFNKSFLFLMLTLMCVAFAGTETLYAKERDAAFEAWLMDLRAEALENGISEEILDRSLRGVTPIPRIIELDRKQPENTVSFVDYRRRILSKTRIEKGRKLLRKYEADLRKVSAKYGVAPQYIVALWGIETSYGEYTGSHKVIPALVTLAYDGRRSAFFRKELMIAFQILQQGHIAPEDMKGSWAGAMGQNQFMPSSFQSFAVDNSDDGRRDIWRTKADIFASSANYLAKSGWKDGERWGREVRLPRGFSEGLISKKIRKPLEDWQDLGVRLPGGGDLPTVQGFDASLVAPDGIDGPGYMIYNNYRTVLKWNRSDYFASCVGLLADQIASAIGDR